MFTEIIDRINKGRRVLISCNTEKSEINKLKSYDDTLLCEENYYFAYNRQDIGIEIFNFLSDKKVLAKWIYSRDLSYGDTASYRHYIFDDNGIFYYLNYIDYFGQNQCDIMAYDKITSTKQYEKLRNDIKEHRRIKEPYDVY